MGGREVQLEVSADVIVRERVDWPRTVFRDRTDAGEALARLLVTEPEPEAVVLALPRGGVPVAVPLARALGAPVTPISVRKLPIPDSPEMGFGAVTLDGTVTLNHIVMRRFGVTFGQAAVVIERVKEELRRRADLYPGASVLPNVHGRRVYLIDDGLATGYTMIATSEMISHNGPAHVTIAVPVAPAATMDLLLDHCDRLACLLVQEGEQGFAVASFYAAFPDITDEEVLRALRSTGAATGTLP